MLFILIAWLLTLLIFAIWLRALHGIPIYTHTPLQADSQRLQLQTLCRITQLQMWLALGVVTLHFTLSPETQTNAARAPELLAPPTNASGNSQNSSEAFPVGSPMPAFFP
jgi:hypothetical protein